MNIEGEKPHQGRKPRKMPPPNLPNSASAQCYWALANSFASAAEQLLANQSSQALVPILYLLGHSLELHLKAFIIRHGVPEKNLRNEFGHDLVSSLRQCKRIELCSHLSLSYNQIRQIVRVNHYYQEKQLEYFYATHKHFGSIENFRDIVNQTSQAVFISITDNDFRALSKS